MNAAKQMEPETALAPEWRIVRIDETQHWNEASKARRMGGKLIASYAYNRNSHTYCCSVTPAYWLVYLGTDFDLPGESLFVEEREQIDEEIREAEIDDVSGYYACHDVDRWKSKPLPYAIDVDREDYADVDAYDRAVEDEIREAYGANPC